jgi:hypothetical protein
VRGARTGTRASGSIDGCAPLRRRGVRTAAGAFWTAVFAAGLVAPPAFAKPLDQLIPGLFGGTLSTTIVQNGSDQSHQQALIIQQFRNLSAQLSVARSQVPIPSSSGAFSYTWDSELDTFVRSEQSLGPIFAERAQTLGRGRFNFGFAYQHVDYSTLNGDSLNDITAVQPAFTSAYLAHLSPSDRAVFGNNLITTRLSLSFTFDLFYLNAAYGVTDDIDVSLGLTINRAALSGNALAMTLNPADPRATKVALFASNQPGVLTNGNGAVCMQPFRCAADSFDESAFGTGDLYLRGKWHMADTRFVDIAAAGVLTLPTGNADNFLGFHDPTFTPWLILSKPFWRLDPHVNVGYAFRSGSDVGQFQWIAGADLLTTHWLTLTSDFLGYYDYVNDNVVQWSPGFKTNPLDGLVISTGFQIPVNRDGLRADVIYTGQIEYNF